MTEYSPNAALRPLTAQEEIYWLLNWTSPTLPVLAAHVSGPTTPRQWRAALDRLQARHPLLAVSIEAPSAGQDRPYFRQRHGSEIPLRIVERAAAPRWEAEVERELAAPFAPGQAPLLRAVLIHEADRSTIILSACHAIADGVSSLLLLRDLLAAMDGRPLAPLPFPPSAEEKLGLAPAAAGHAQNAGELGRAPVNGAGAPSVRILQLSPALTQGIVEASRERGATLQGALAAAVVLAARRQAPEFAAKPLRFISPVNTRPVLGVGEDCGLYFTSPQISFDPSEPLPFWEMARQTRQRIAEAATREAVLAVTDAMRGMIADGLDQAGTAEMLHGVFAEDVLLSNLGRVPFPSSVGRLHLDSVWCPAVLAGLPEMQTVGAATTNGALCLLQTSFQPIPHLLEAVRDVLSGVCAKVGQSTT